jgi:hypothetical protein
MTQEYINIIGGPGKFELMLALFEGREITFTLEGGAQKTVKLNTIQREDGSNQSWNLDGYTVGPTPNMKFHAYYTTRGNHGTYSLTHPLVTVSK